MAINLTNGQKAERKLLVTVIEFNDGENDIKEILGTRTEDSSIEFNPDIATITDIRGITYTDVNKVEATQSFDPFFCLGGSKLFVKLRDIYNRAAWSELGAFTTYVIEMYDGTETDGFVCTKETGCTVVANSLGGDAYVNMPIEVHYSGNKDVGTAKAFKMAEDGSQSCTFTFTSSQA